MSALNDWMVAKFGPNWKTSVTGISNALLSIAGTAGVLTVAMADNPQDKTIVAALSLGCAVLSGVAKIFNA